MIYIDNKKKSEKTLTKLYPKAKCVDITSKATTSLVKLSPFYPHGNIPIPFSPGKTAKCVEGIWQGLKVFNHHGIDKQMFENDTMKNIKRTVRKFGKPIGHRKGINGNCCLDYMHARIYIYLPSYLWVLENKVAHIISRLQEANKQQDIVLLDYSTNNDVLDPRKPLSHAYLVKAYAEGNYPQAKVLEYKLNEIKNSGKNPYENRARIKKKEKVLSTNDIIQEVIKVINQKPLTSKEILSELRLDMPSKSLTNILKKTNKIETIKGKPLRFRKRTSIQGKLF